MKKLTLGLSALALAVAGTAYAAQDGQKHGPDADGNGVVTRAETQAFAARMFTRMDANKDGKLTEADRTARREARRTAMFAKLDSNSNGQVSREEFMTFDRDGDGKDGKHHRMGREGGHGGKGMMAMADTNKDGAVDKAEFAAGALKHFDQMDANKDGQVTKEEGQVARKAMRAKWREMKQDRTAS